MPGDSYAAVPTAPFREEFRCDKFSPKQPNPEWLATSPFMNNYAVLVLRFLLMGFNVGVLIFSGIDEGGPKWFIYLTNWQYFMLTVASLGAFLLTLIHVTKYYDKSEKEIEAMPDPEWRWYHSTHAIISAIAVTMSIIATLLYWLFLGGSLFFLNVATHAINALVTLLDVALTNVKVNIFHAVYSMLFATIYILMSVAYTLPGGTNNKGQPFIYELLDWKNKPTSAAIIAVPTALIGAPLVHFLVFLVCKARIELALWLSRRGGKGETTKA